ncbi:MAG: hypothetical protein ACLP22_19435 [Solirubrobacteraceae bacterium]
MGVSSVPGVPGVSGVDVVAIFVEVGSGQPTGLCVRRGASQTLASLGDMAIAAKVLVDDALAQRPPASFAVGLHGFQGHSGHWRSFR